MQTKMSRIAIAVQAVLCLTACQSIQKEEPSASAPSIAPYQNVRHGVPRPEALYALGRYYQGQIRYEQAIDAYRGLLEVSPDHAEGRNALGMILAAQGKYDEAIAQFERAVANAPSSARMRNNLGYAHLMRGDSAEAAAILATAAQLDPRNRRVRENLQIALASAETSGPSGPSGPTAPENPTTTTVAKADLAPVETTSIPAPLSATVDGMRLQAVGPNVFSLVSAVQAPAAEAAPAEAVALSVPDTALSGRVDMDSTEKRVRLEVSNGNGITGMARETSRQLQGVGYAKARLTNEMPFRLATTEIQYRPGFEVQARKLQTVLRPGVPVVASSQLRSDVQVRLALGKDARSSTELVAKTPAVRTAARPGEPGGSNMLPAEALLDARSAAES